MEQWRKDMNARLGMARAEAAAGNQAAANNYFAAAQNIANINSPQTANVVRSQGAPQVLVGVGAGGAIDQMRINGVGATTTTTSGGGGGGGSGGGGGGGTYTPPPPPPTPINPWITTPTYVAPTGIKQADPSIILFNDRPISPEYMLEVEYESLSGMELINISRSDLINGQDVVYSPIKNLSLIRRRYNPNNIINLSELSASFFSRFAIDLVQRGMNQPYFDNEGNLIIEIENVRDDEVIEVEIDTNATIEEVMFE